MPPIQISTVLVRLAGFGWLAAAACPAFAEKADRSLPMTIESNPCVVDLAKRTHVCTGNVIITQGTLQIRAERVELRETADGFNTAQATGTTAKPAVYREKREGVDEYVEGTAQRIDYDGRAASVRFEGQALVRTLRGTAPVDELHGRLIVWNANTQQLSVEGGAPTTLNPAGRTRWVLAPSAAAASGAAPAAASGVAPLRSTGALGERR